MNQLVKIKKIKGIEDIFTDSMIIAQGTNNQHESIARIINSYLKEIETFGEIRLTDLKSGNSKGGIPPKSRDRATRRVLEVIYNLENLIEHVIKEEAKKETYYKDIYKICKAKCKLMAELSYLPSQRLIA